MSDDLAVKKIFPIQGKLIAKDSTKQDKEKRIKQKTDALDKPMFYKNKPIYRHLKFTTNINKQDTYLNEIREQFIFNIFKIENKVFFAPEESFLTPLEYLLALENIYSKILSLRMYMGDVKQKDPYKFKNSDLGSVQITLDFLHNSPYYNCTIKTKGFRHDEIEDLFEYVWKNRHSNSNKDLR
jgi:hypothetical protein